MLFGRGVICSSSPGLARLMLRGALHVFFVSGTRESLTTVATVCRPDGDCEVKNWCKRQTDIPWS